MGGNPVRSWAALAALSTLAACGGSSSDSTPESNPPEVAVLEGFDPTFGGGVGWVVIDSGFDEEARALALDGNAILLTGDRSNGTDTDMFVLRLLPSGLPDMNFGTAGVFLDDGAAGGSGDDAGYAIGVDSEGRILVAGRSGNGGGDQDMAVWRLLADGTLDPDFGTAGIFTDGGGVGFDQAFALAIDANDGLYVAGRRRESVMDAGDLAIWHLMENGTLDASFGAGGVALHDGGAGGDGLDNAYAVIIPSGGGPLAGGKSITPLGVNGAILWRYDELGDPVGTFGTSGIEVYDDAEDFGVDADVITRSVVEDALGRFVSVGWSAASPSPNDARTFLWRYDDDGVLDPMFGIGGVVVFDPGYGGSNNGRSLVLDAVGRVVVTGFIDAAPSDPDMGLWRFHPDGSLDTSFNGVGFGLHGSAAGGVGAQQGNGVAIDDLQRIVVAGVADNGTDGDIVVWRYAP